MDRPEDISPNETNGRVYVMLTNNTRREEPNPANPRADNAFGHIVEIVEAEGDFAANSGTWEVMLQCGDPSIAEVGATFSTETTENGWFGVPDNSAIDADGRLWVSTDGNSPSSTGRTDGLWAVDTADGGQPTSKLFFRVPIGGELCRPDADSGPRDDVRRRATPRGRRRGLGRLRSPILLRGPFDALARLPA